MNQQHPFTHRRDAEPETLFYAGVPPHRVWAWNSATGESEPLDLRLDLRVHSPTGFSWGYHGSGPAQLALAILAHATGDDRPALIWYQSFKRHYVANWPQGQPWRMDRAEVLAWVETHARISIRHGRTTGKT
jgi:hypothetical protein